MTAQLLLLTEPESDWRIPEETKAIGRRGIAEARAVLRGLTRRDETGAPAGSPTDSSAEPASGTTPIAA